MTMSVEVDASGLHPDAVEFVRFCHARRAVAWPELYDVMCAVARGRLFRGWGYEELAEHGVEFGLAGLAAFAATTRRLLAEDVDRARQEERSPAD